MTRLLSVILIASLLLGLVIAPPAARAAGCASVAMDVCEAPARDAGGRVPGPQTCSKCIMLDSAGQAAPDAPELSEPWAGTGTPPSGLSPSPLRRPPRG